MEKKRYIVTSEDERPNGAGSGKCFYCPSKIGEEHTKECVVRQSPSLAENKILPPNAWIQWKGTDVCCDITCQCGEGFHYDGDFMYHIQCPYCNQVYECSGYIQLYPLDFKPEGTKEIEKESYEN